VAALQKAATIDPTRAQDLIRDRVHPGAAGQLLMAKALLKAWNAPTIVTTVAIDAAAKKVVQEENAKVEGLGVADAIAWTQLDSALPMPINLKDRIIELAVKASDVEEALNQQVLKVSGIRGAKCQLKIDGEDVATLSAEQLEVGVNLAMYPTPMWRQAKEVHELTVQHNNIHFQRWRAVQVPLEKLGYASLPGALEALDALEAEVVAAQRARAKPVPHRFEVILLRPSPSDGPDRP
jgi:hypothetical protein